MNVEKLLVVTDLDATLLDTNYEWQEARSAVERLHDLKFPLVFNSSKTISEMRDLSEEMKNFSVEDLGTKRDSQYRQAEGSLLNQLRRSQAGTTYQPGQANLSYAFP